MTSSHVTKLADGIELLARGLLGLRREHDGPKAGEIPLPCWYPQPAGEFCSHAPARATTTLRIRVANCGPTARLIRPEAADGVVLKPAKLALAPMQRGLVTVSFKLPADAGAGDEYEQVVWIRGCQSHYVRWRIVVAEKDAEPCRTIDVEDRPDHLHHWYDHFYCSHPCLAGDGGRKP